MTKIKTQQQIQNKIRYQTMSEFLEHVPPAQSTEISDLVTWQKDSQFNGFRQVINKPDLQLHCQHESCDGHRFFRCVSVSREGEYLDQISFRYFYLTYQCSNCLKSHKIYSLSAKLVKNGQPQGICYKIGELPLFGPHIPSKLIALIGPDRDLFLQGRRCESQGLGIGAFTYYRRVVENQKNRILTQIMKTADKIGTTQDTIDKLNAAIEETQFKRALDMAKDVIPDKLFINNQNPILVLHQVLSGGVHEFSDERCLELARDVRVVLGELSERMSFVLKDDVEIGRALSNLMNRDNN